MFYQANWLMGSESFNLCLNILHIIFHVAIKHSNVTRISAELRIPL